MESASNKHTLGITPDQSVTGDRNGTFEPSVISREGTSRSNLLSIDASSLTSVGNRNGRTQDAENNDLGGQHLDGSGMYVQIRWIRLFYGCMRAQQIQNLPILRFVCWKEDIVEVRIGEVKERRDLCATQGKEIRRAGGNSASERRIFTQQPRFVFRKRESVTDISVKAIGKVLGSVKPGTSCIVHSFSGMSNFLTRYSTLLWRGHVRTHEYRNHHVQFGIR